MDDVKLFKQSIDAEKIDLARLGWTENRSDKSILSYVRGYIRRNYKIGIKPPLDWIIFCMINEALGEQMDNKKC